MDEIFKKWINYGYIDLDKDLIPVMLEYDNLYNDGTLTAQDCLQFLRSIQLPWKEFVDGMLKMIARKKQGQLVEVYDRKKMLLRRYWYEMDVS